MYMYTPLACTPLSASVTEPDLKLEPSYVHLPKAGLRQYHRRQLVDVLDGIPLAAPDDIEAASMVSNSADQL